VQPLIARKFDDERAGSHVAEPAVVARADDKQQSDAAEVQVDKQQQPPQQIVAHTRRGAVGLDHPRLHGHLSQSLAVVERLKQERIEHGRQNHNQPGYNRERVSEAGNPPSEDERHRYQIYHNDYHVDDTLRNAVAYTGRSL